ncbi:hypothetical protein GCM10027029_01650 [Conyzicola lurida]
MDSEETGQKSRAKVRMIRGCYLVAHTALAGGLCVATQARPALRRIRFWPRTGSDPHFAVQLFVSLRRTHDHPVD